MENSSKVQALRRQVEAKRAASKGGRPRYPEELKEAVLALVAEPGWGATRVSAAVGLAESIIYRWSRSRGRRKTSSKLWRVEVVPEARTEARTFDVELAAGAKIVGLTWSEVTMLVRGER